MKGCKTLVDTGRRQFLRGGVAATAGMAAAAMAPGRSEAAEPHGYPSAKLANITDLKTNKPMDISYPDGDSPGVLLKLGKKVPGGAGPDGDIVAYSTLCPHKGFVLNYDGRDKTLNCPGHYSRFDVELEGQQIFGQANQNLPMFTLSIDSKGDIHATGVDELIFGRTSNVLA